MSPVPLHTAGAVRAELAIQVWELWDSAERSVAVESCAAVCYECNSATIKKLLTIPNIEG